MSPPLHLDQPPLLQEHIQERLRLARFQFPAKRSSAPPEAIPDLFSSCDDHLKSSPKLVPYFSNALGISLMEYEELYDEKARAFAHERPTRPESTVRLPSIPPPAYLDLDREMEPERFEYPSA